MRCTATAMLLRVSDPNDRGYRDLTFLPDGSDYPERAWFKTDSDVGKAVAQSVLAVDSRATGSLVLDIRPAVTKEGGRAYLNSRLVEFAVVGSAKPARSGAAANGQ